MDSYDASDCGFENTGVVKLLTWNFLVLCVGISRNIVFGKCMNDRRQFGSSI